MTQVTSDIINDPLFQLNALLWLAQPISHESTIVPLLHDKGFSVYAIAPALAIPPDLKLKAQDSGISTIDLIRPDVVLANEVDGKFAMTECKKSSFGPTSTTSEQARGMILVSGPHAADVLGLSKDQVKSTIFVYATDEHNREPLKQTLNTLISELQTKGLPTSTFSILGFRMDASRILVVVDEEGNNFFRLPVGEIPFLTYDDDTDPRPLYFIPYDPTVYPTQNSREQEYCRRIVYERLQSGVIYAVGRSVTPEFLIEIDALLTDATFGMYANWQDRGARGTMKQLCKQFMRSLMQTANLAVPRSMTQEGNGWKIKMDNEEQQTKILDALANFSCETLNLRAEPQPDLFDKLETEVTN